MKSIRPNLCFRILKRLINLTFAFVIGKTVLATPIPYFSSKLQIALQSVLGRRIIETQERLRKGLFSRSPLRYLLILHHKSVFFRKNLKHLFYFDRGMISSVGRALDCKAGGSIPGAAPILRVLK